MLEILIKIMEFMGVDTPEFVPMLIVSSVVLVGVRSMVKEQQKEMVLIRKDLNKIAEIQQLRFESMDKLDEYRDKMHKSLSNALIYLKNQEVRQFISEKYRLFIDLAMKTHRMKWDLEQKEIALEMFREGSETVKMKGYKILGKSFIDEFYLVHDQSVKCFIRELEKIFDDKVNDKHERFHLECERLIKGSISDIYKVADQFNKIS